MNDKPTCKTCKFWVKGECKRYPPQTSGSYALYEWQCATWFKTKPTDWCGEHSDFNKDKS